MAGFKEWAAIRKVHDGKFHWKLVNNLVYHAEDGNSYTVVAGFLTDLATIPRILWPVFSPMDSFLSASVLHDYLYSTHRLKRKEADGLFLQAMKYSNVPLWKRQIIYRAVRLFGGSHY